MRFFVRSTLFDKNCQDIFKYLEIKEVSYTRGLSS